MECLIQIAFHRFPVGSDRLQHGRCGRSRCGKQGFDKAAGLVGIQLNQIALMNNLPRSLTDMYENKSTQRAPLQGGGFRKKLFIRWRHTGNESNGFSFFCDCWHGRNVCRCGTHCKNGFFHAPRLHRRPACRAARHRVVRGAWLANAVPL